MFGRVVWMGSVPRPRSLAKLGMTKEARDDVWRIQGSCDRLVGRVDVPDGLEAAVHGRGFAAERVVTAVDCSSRDVSPSLCRVHHAADFRPATARWIRVVQSGRTSDFFQVGQGLWVAMLLDIMFERSLIWWQSGPKLIYLFGQLAKSGLVSFRPRIRSRLDQLQ